MIGLPGETRVWLATGHTYIRRGMAGLALQVQKALGRDLHVSDLYAFCARRGDLIKIIWNEGICMSLFAKRLDRGRFTWRSSRDRVVAISAAQLGYVLDGIDWHNLRRTGCPEAVG